MSRSIQYHTFWTKTIKESDFSVKEVANVLNIGASTLRNYLTGNSMPSDNCIQNICKLFNVNFNEGKQQFTEAYNAYHNIEDVAYTSTDTKAISTNKQNKLTEVDVDLVLSTIYSKVAYDKYNQIANILRTEIEAV